MAVKPASLQSEGDVSLVETSDGLPKDRENVVFAAAPAATQKNESISVALNASVDANHALEAACSEKFDMFNDRLDYYEEDCHKAFDKIKKTQDQHQASQKVVEQQMTGVVTMVDKVRQPEKRQELSQAQVDQIMLGVVPAVRDICD
ncbi:hypothetical protein AK830_g6333 [Neonectria ditissima]|uniref:Uncharacterized protein n=1 Tax=Neonectria ditissima TaxID=78410 RepID=A0A0P7AQX1_9HYPO|nr:hypothetical protein AK830_g6333 [Neonectria ditissima]